MLQKLKNIKANNDGTNKEDLEGHKKRSRAKWKKSFQEKDKEVQSKAASPATNMETRVPSSKGSTHQKSDQGAPLVDEEVLNSLSVDCLWLHTCVGNLPDDNPLPVGLRKNQFFYFDDTFTWIFKKDISEFLAGDMLNVSILQVFMRL